MVQKINFNKANFDCFKFDVFGQLIIFKSKIKQ